MAPAVDARLEDVRTVAVLRALGLGDMLCAVPTFRSLRHRFPAARITLIGLPWGREFVDRYHGYIDDLVEFPGFPGIPERDADPARIIESIAEFQARHFDLAIQLHGSGVSSNSFVALLGARISAGFILPGTASLPPTTDGIWVEYPDHGHEVHRLLRVADALGGEVDDALEFPLTAVDEAELATTLPSPLPRERYAVIHPGASHPVRRWPTERFAAAADHLARTGLHIVITGTDAERAVAGEVAAKMQERVLDLSGRTSLGALGVLIRDAALLFANDTGVSHVAAAVRTPSVILFSEADPLRWAPLDEARHVVLGGVAEGQDRSADGLFADLDEAVAALDALRRRWLEAAVA